MSETTITSNAIAIWKSFPSLVKDDACFSVFCEQIHSGNETRKLENQIDFARSIDQRNSSFFLFKHKTEHTINVEGSNNPDENLLGKNSAGESEKNDRKPKGKTASRPKWKYIVFFVIWLLSAWHLLTVKEKVLIKHDILIDSMHTKTLNLSYNDHGKKITISLIGLVLRERSTQTNSSDVDENSLTVNVRNKNKSNNSVAKVYDFIFDDYEENTVTFDFYPDVSSSSSPAQALNLTFTMSAVGMTDNPPISLHLLVNPNAIVPEIGVLAAAIILIFFNVLLGAEIVHRTVAAIFTTFASIGILAALHDRPSMGDIITWIDCETIILIFSMMVLVAILSDTGFFEHIAVYTYQISRGQIWPLISTLCVISAVISMFLDNVTTILLMTPVVIKLFECLGLNPVPVLPFIILNINIAGLTTLIGHPPNLLITENTFVAAHNVNFVTYAMHMSVGVFLALIQTNIHLRIQCRNIDKMVRKIPASAPTRGQNSELDLWQQCVHAIESRMRDKGDDEDIKNLKLILAKKIESLKSVTTSTTTSKNFIHKKCDKKSFPLSLELLKKSYPITDKQLLRKAVAILVLIILLFFVGTIPTIQNQLSLAWCAFVGVMLLLVITDCQMESILQQVEWVTLLFFMSMFITMECLARLGLIKWIGKQTENIILLANEPMRLSIAIIIILWFSALSSSVVDSTPVTAMMVKVLDTFARNEHLNLPIKPIVFALAFGPTLGANGNLFGASSNILCAGVAEKLGYKMTCSQYFKIGFPVMIGNVLLVTIYLLIAHVLFEWH